MKKFLSLIISIVIIGYTIVNGDYMDFLSTNEIKQVANVESDEFKIHFIDVGQADAILIESDEQFMLVDAGNNGDGDLVTGYLKKEGVTKLEYVIGTHAHEDHIGGMDNVIREFNVENFFMPKVITTTKTFETVLDELLLKGIKFQTPKINDVYTLGSANFEVLHVGTDNDNLNNTSIVIKVNYKNTSYLLTGDAEEEVEKDLQNVKADVLKLGHHGSKYSTSDEFLSRVNPQIAIISVGLDNKYGHPHKETIDKLKNINTYNTIDSGTIIINSDGDKISVETEK